MYSYYARQPTECSVAKSVAKGVAVSVNMLTSFKELLSLSTVKQEQNSPAQVLDRTTPKRLPQRTSLPASILQYPHLQDTQCATNQINDLWQILTAFHVVTSAPSFTSEARISVTGINVIWRMLTNC